MFDALIRRLTAPTPDTLPQPDADLALAALLVRIARADGDYAPEEIARIDRILAKRDGLTADAAAALRARAEVLEEQAPDTVRFTRALKDAIAIEGRCELLEAMWSVALADAARDDMEDRLMRLVVSLLGLTDQQSAIARQKAAQS
ncbi:TerB family tellurite resistance protein [Pseudorhodobacter sp.]|uniref:tellurite resistance TerB family protein n=1 Tax=Pseudorhodobacter sp. TaxID=1934400 RepID=UPI002649787B|nr:TerB family tellurite resistance protein [Pseudorhodobacter sp.]MDN5787326.1 TerB family tellurite resistance protein [Pseudorhodobacter sp.]